MNESRGSAARIAVCMKSVRVPSVRLRLNDSGTAVRPGDAPAAVNPADLSALQWALAAGREAARSEVMALTVAPESAEEPLRWALAAGVRQVLRVWNPSWVSEDWENRIDGSAGRTLLAARAAAAALLPLRPEVVLTGESSLDGAHGCFGAFLAHALGAAYAHRAIRLRREGEGWIVRVKLERGYVQEMALPPPLVVSVSASLPGPAYPPLPAWIASRAAAIPFRPVDLPHPALPESALRPPVPRVKAYRLPPADLDAEGRIRALVEQPQSGGGSVLPEGEDPHAQAEAILNLLRTRGYVGRG